MALSVDVTLRRGAFQVEAAFETGPGVTALFGASGSGKTSILNMIAGVLTPERGRIRANEQVWFDSASRITVPPAQRGVGYVFQDGRLFPHLSVRRNLLYGYQRLPPQARYVHPADIIPFLALEPLLERRPETLSGGEQQRVAIGRALLMSPRILLLDEPLSSLDAARKADIMPYLERLRDTVQIPMLYVSHEWAEIDRLAARVVHIESGRIVRIEERAALARCGQAAQS
jgi:molybdate transport system ATP-binding protein